MPLLYLLCADTVSGAQFVLQRLLVSMHAGVDLGTDYLQEWARSTANWAPKLIEALTIVRADACLRRYGIEMDSATERYKPRLPDIAEHNVHPILKWLAHLCEHLLPGDTQQLIETVCGANPDERYRLHRLPASQSPERYLELWLLHWQSERLIAVGDYTPGADTRRRASHCNVDVLVHALLAASKVDDRLRTLGENLRRAQIRFNFTSEGYIQPGGDKLKKKGAASTNEEDGAVDAGTDTVPPSKSVQSAQPPAVTLTSAKNNNVASIDDDRYVVRSTHAGFALIIDQTNFVLVPTSAPVKGPLANRHGSINDRQALLTTFGASGYRCEVRENLTAVQIEQEIINIVQRSGALGGSDCDSLVVCVLSHGFRGHVFGSDTVPVSVDRIVALMSSKRLVGKPKLLVVQACQGEQLQELVYSEDEDAAVEVLESDGPTDGGRSSGGGGPRVVGKSAGQHTCTDFCIAQSTMPGFPSYRNTCRGTWFIQSLCNAIKEHSKR